MAADTVDPIYLSSYLNLPPSTLTSVLDSPTTDLVNSVLAAVTLKAREHEELQADKLRVDIELENAVRSSETRSQGLKATVEKALKEVEELRQQLKTEENTRSALETELQTLKSSSSTSTSEVETLKHRISSLESANRDTVAVLEAKTTANDILGQDLQKQHQKALDLGQQVTALQQSIQNANSAASSAKFREQTLQQEIELAKRNNDWLETELKTKSAEALKFRKEKGARIAELQRQNEEANSNLTAAKRTEQALRTRLEEIQKKAEDSFAKIQQLQESAATMQEGFRQELESAHRLADLQAQQTETHRNRLKEVEAALEQVKDDAAQQIGVARQAAEEERTNADANEAKVAELQAQVDELLNAAETFSVPGTPRRGLNGSTFGGRPGSPAVGTPGSARKSATQLHSELFEVKNALVALRRKHDALEAEKKDMIMQLEAKVPEHQEKQEEYDRLQQEIVEMSKFVDQTGTERDKAKKDARVAQNAANAAETEAKILRQQSRDLSVQIKILLCELDARDRGLESLSASEKAQLERIARGEISEEALQGLTDTDRFISQRLTVFHNISELQEKNQELLKLTRTLGDRMESEEALAEKHQAAADHEEVLSLRTKIENYKDELKSMITRSESYIKERDMFRRMLQYRGQLPPQSDLGSMFEQSVDGDGNGIMSSIEQSPGSKNNVDNGRLLRELQSQFDQYREEQSIDRRTLKEQAEKLANDRSSLQADIAKIGSQLAHANERYDMLHANYKMLQNENSELSKRSLLLSESAAKQDLKTQQVAEELIEARAAVESMRNENANLKAEKKLAKDIQGRLGQDNESLTNEKNRLNNMVADHQRMLNEREISETENRRRLVSQIEALESELNLTKRKLNDEVEESKKNQLRKEYDNQQNQKRIDDLVASLSTVREELVAAKTTRDMLQARVDELVIELKSAEERVELLQPRATPRAGARATDTDIDQTEAEDTITREQELGVEVSELKRDLELAKSDLENTRSQMEQYKEISQQSEEELQSLNETQDQYREEMDRMIEERDTKIRELQQRVEDISSELSTTNNEMTGLRNSQSEVVRKHEEEKTALETEISRLKEEDERHATAAQFHQQDLRAQAEIATKAQQDYETELVKHAEAAKILQSLRAEYNSLKSETVTFKTEAESAKADLAQSQSSWEESREQFERELADLRTRRDEIDAQNKLLHQQLESVTSQISALQQSRATFTESGELEPSTNGGATDRTVEELRELIKYLRREKEIVDVQYDLAQQEAKRIKQQFDYSQSQLDEARLKLDQERRSQGDGARNTMAHKELMERLEELNLFRESSATLRGEVRELKKQLDDKTRRVEELLGQVKPLETRIHELENARETQDGELRLLQEDRDRWQKRTQDIISKYDRIDPAEMEQLKETIATLQAEKDALLAEQQPLREQAQNFEEDRKKWQQSREALIAQSKERNRAQNKTIADRTAERDTAISEKDALEQQLLNLRQEIETAVQEKGDAEQRFETLKGELDSVKSERDEAIANARPTSSGEEETSPQSTASAEQLAAIQQELQSLKQSKETLEKELEATRAELDVTKQQVETLKVERDQALAKAADVQSGQAAQAGGNTQDDSEEGQIDESGSKSCTSEEHQTLQARLDASESLVKELQNKVAEIEASIDTTVKARSDKMKSILNQKLIEKREEIRNEERAQYETKLAQDKAIWMAENAAPANAAPSATGAPVVSAQMADSSAPNTPQKSNANAEDTANVPDLSDQQVRHLLATNPTIKSIVTSNVKKRMELESHKIKEEAEAQLAATLAEAEKKAEDAKIAAVAMETKKSSVRINMSENRFKTANAKIEIVEVAARETPDKPVGEVWEVAKSAKPAPAVAAPAVKKDSAGPTPPAQIPVPQKVERSSNTLFIPQPTARPPTGPAAANGSAMSTSTSSVPVPTQPAGNRAASGSSIPRGGANTRGRGIPRPGHGGVYTAPNGRGRGSGNNQAGTNQAGGSAPNSRPSSALGTNPFAQTFSPNTGNKRPREDSGGHDGNGAKRGRGGSGGRGQSY